MGKWWYLPLAVAVCCAAVYCLYRRGLAVSRSIRAVAFMLRPGRDGERVSLNTCTGWVRHRVRLSESRTCAFTLDARLTGGDAAVTVLDGNGRQLLWLDPSSPAGTLETAGRERYALRWEFRSATGTCVLRWQ